MILLGCFLLLVDTHFCVQERTARLAMNSHVSAIGLAAESDLKVAVVQSLGFLFCDGRDEEM